MGALIDETGNVYDRLTVLGRAVQPRHKPARWLCLCDCGTWHAPEGVELRRGNVRSCGCLNVEQKQETRTDDPPELRRWLLDGVTSGPCMDCDMWPEDHCQMDLDHLYDKTFNLSQWYQPPCRTMHEIVTEIAKCDLVCANCHRLRTKLRKAV